MCVHTISTIFEFFTLLVKEALGQSMDCLFTLLNRLWAVLTHPEDNSMSFNCIFVSIYRLKIQIQFGVTKWTCCNTQKTQTSLRLKTHNITGKVTWVSPHTPLCVTRPQSSEQKGPTPLSPGGGVPGRIWSMATTKGTGVCCAVLCCVQQQEQGVPCNSTDRFCAHFWLSSISLVHPLTLLWGLHLTFVATVQCTLHIII